MFRPLFREMFDSLWINFEPLTRPKAERVESLTLDVPLSFRQAFAGGLCGGTDTHSGPDWRVRHAAEEEASDPTNAGAVKWRNINGRVSDMVNCAAGLQGDHIVRLFPHSGIENFYLTVLRASLRMASVFCDAALACRASAISFSVRPTLPPMKVCALRQ
jgi:hypothetical protein